MKNSFSFSRYRLLKSKNSAGQILGFHRFPKKYCPAISVCDVTDDLCSQCEADVSYRTKEFVSTEPGSQIVNFEDFRGIFRSLPCGTSRMWICSILSPYLSGPWPWTECNNDHVLVVCYHVDGGIRLSCFILAGFMAGKMPICSILVDHGRIISVTVKQLVTSTLSVRSTVTRPRPMRLS